ncbi:MAG TPA: acetylxylan esterase [Firmicutes bacterium]|nr:acetylxylan esterase [Bacillota bacterium]
MKKIFSAVLSVCMLMVIASGCASDQTGASASASASQTASATADGTDSPISPSEDNLMLFDFEEAEADIFAQQDLSSYNIPLSETSITEDNTDAGKGYKVLLDYNGGCWCQNFSAAMPEEFKQANQYKYVRIWVSNQGEGTLSIGMILNGGGASGSLNTSDAVVTRCDGTVLETQTDDSAGTGAQDHVKLPAGFSGWLAFPVAGEILPYWSNPVIEDISAAESFNFDIRPGAPSGMDYYVLDDICLTDSEKGTEREYIGQAGLTLEEVKSQVETGLAGMLDVTPNITYMPEYDPKSSASGANSWSNIKALTYDGVEIDGEKTKVFAYIGYPEGVSSTNKAPAIVLLHGGGGHAYAEWVKLWTDRGYVAIAMDNTGYFPSEAGKGLAGRELDPASYWTFGLSGDFAQEGYTNAPNNSGMNDAGSKAERQWMYHAVAQTILAHNILRADEMVDSSRIGVTGISWGGVIASIAIGYDTRWAFAIPIYGSGYLEEALSFMGPNFNTEASLAVWSAQEKFDNVDFPVLWLGWNSDNCFSINSNSKSYLDTKDNDKTVLSMINNMNHSHSSGWVQPISYHYADWIVNGGSGLTQLMDEPSGRDVYIQHMVPLEASSISAKIYYITEKMTYSQKPGNSTTTMDQTWQTVDCEITGSIIKGTVPESAYSYYVEITTTVNGTNYVTCSSYVELG